MDVARTLCVWIFLLTNPFVADGMELIEQLYQASNTSERTALENGILKLLRLIKTEVDYGYIVIWRDYTNSTSSDCLLENSMVGIMDEPFMVIRNGSNDNVLSDNHPKTVLMLSCWPGYTDVEKVKLIQSYFPFLIYHLIWVEKDTEVSSVCETIANGSHSGLLIIDKDSLGLEMIHTCTGKVARKENYSCVRRLFRQEGSDINGSEIVTESDQLPPRSILYYDGEGNLQMVGFVANCITSFAKRYNAKLVITPPLKLGMAVPYEVLVNKTFRGLLDIPAISAPYKADRFSDIYYSYPVELMELCYMIPLPQLMEANQVFTYIIDVHVMIVITLLSFVYGVLFTIGTYKSAAHLSFSNVLLNDRSVRVLLGQSFVMPAKPCIFMQYVCFLLCYTSLIISTTYQAYLQSNLIHPALQKRVESYEDMRKAGLMIAISKQDTGFLDSAILLTYADLFQFVGPLDDILKLRASMDTRYVYPVSSTRWQVFSQQQRLFQRSLFYYSPNLCLKKRSLLSIPFRPDLPYKSLFNQHLLDLSDTGLLQYWISDNFYTMVRLNYTTFEDLSTPEEFADAIELGDFKWVWIFYAACLMLSSTVFVGELVCHHRNNKYSHV